MCVPNLFYDNCLQTMILFDKGFVYIAATNFASKCNVVDIEKKDHKQKQN